MNEDFLRYIGTRCDAVAVNDPEYRRIQGELADAHKNNDIESYAELSIKLEIIVQQYCYTQGFKDAMQLMLGQKEA